MATELNATTRALQRATVHRRHGKEAAPYRTANAEQASAPGSSHERGSGGPAGSNAEPDAAPKNGDDENDRASGAKQEASEAKDKGLSRTQNRNGTRAGTGEESRKTTARHDRTPP